MKHIIVSAILVVGAAIGLAAHASAQADEVVKTKVPFDFMVGSHSLPAGSYRIESDGEFLNFSNIDRKVSVFTTSYHGNPSLDGTSRLKFDVVSGQHFLREIETPSTKTTMDFPVSRAERSATELLALHDGNAVTRGR